jgi:hypothetical protein
MFRGVILCARSPKENEMMRKLERLRQALIVAAMMLAALAVVAVPTQRASADDEGDLGCYFCTELCSAFVDNSVSPPAIRCTRVCTGDGCAVWCSCTPINGVVDCDCR